ncbi:MAG: hypothetical protein CSA26_00870, partial [Desulfobacterales bacterium]
EERVITVTPPGSPPDRKVRIFSYCEKDLQQLLTSYQFDTMYELQFQAAAIANRPGRYRALIIRKKE